jgi:hypothetical protein
MKWLRCLSLMCILGGGLLFSSTGASALDYEEYPSIKLRSLDKITARTLTFDAQVGSTIKFGDIFIKIQSCRKPPAIEKNEASAFLQIWQVDKQTKESRWVFSGWMFSSSPALSGMDHPVYDVWVIDCLGKDPEAMPVKDTKPADALPDEGTVPEGKAVAQPAVTPEEQQKTAPAEEESPDTLGADPAPNDTAAPEPDSDAPYTPTQQTPAPAQTAPESHKENIEGIY